ncbi:MAG: AAA family ATPase [Thermoguttaceae bacterium]
MLTQLSVTNFKSWQCIPQMRLAPITGLFGTNSSGKTSILQLLLMLKQTIDSSDRAQVLEFGDERSLTNLGSFRDVVYGHEKPGKVNFSLKWNLAKPLAIKDPEHKTNTLFTAEQLAFSCQLGENGSERLAVSQLVYDLADHRFVLNRKGLSGGKYDLTSEGDGFRFTRTQGRAWALPAPVKFYGFPDQVYAYYQNAGFLSELQLAFESLFGQLYYLGPLREFPQRHYAWKGSEPADMGRRGERVVDAMLAARERKEYLSPGPRRRRQTLEERIAYWLKELGLIHDFSVKAIAENSSIYQVRVQKSPSSAEVLITDVGFGVSQILPVLVLCYYVPEGSIVLLEQPEIHLHPSVQSGLADVFIDAVKNRNIQIILESHSEHLLRRFQRRIAEESLKPKDTALYFCEIDKGGSSLTTLDVNQFGDIENWPKDFFGDEFGEIAAISRAVTQRKKELTH